MSVLPKKMNILVVDDAEFDYFIIKQYLLGIEQVDITVDWAPAYSPGLKKAVFGDYDLVFIDLDLAGESGFELASHMRDMDVQGPFIMFSGVDKDYIDWYRASSLFQGYVPKGALRPERVVSEIKRVFARPDRSVPHRNWSLSDTVIEALPLPLIIVRHDMSIETANKSMLDLLQTNQIDITGRPVKDVIQQSHDDVDRIMRQSQGVILITPETGYGHSIGWSFYPINHVDHPHAAGVMLGMPYDGDEQQDSFLRQMETAFRAVISDPQYVRQ